MVWRVVRPQLVARILVPAMWIVHIFKVMLRLTVGQGLKRGCSKLGNTGHLYINKASLMSRQGWEASFLCSTVMIN